MTVREAITIEIDHVVVVVRDLGEAAEFLLSQHGINSVAGGRHPGHGTENRIVPLGPNYIELLGVADQDEAQGSEFGRWALRLRHQELKVAALCLRTDYLDGLCEDLELVSTEMSRARPDGSKLRWRIAGLERALTGESMPFFIQWADPGDLPSRLPIRHQVEVEGITKVTISGDEARLRGMTGGAAGVEVVAGGPGIVSATVGSSAGELVLNGVGSS